ncbi:cyclin-L2 isoform X2 [Tursiops truncatus]|uniref:cyclin-L2 isoform X2 n=1 Tax=Tursiops truncatus TaxID=9739 RepID=UPI003CCF1CC4
MATATATAGAGAPGPAAPAAAAGTPASGGAAPGSQGVLIGDRLYSGVLITLENCLLPDDKLRFTPSMSSGLDTDTETDLRVVGCELIQAAGILLRLPQVRERPRASGRGCHGYRAGVVPAVLLHQVLCEAFHGGCTALNRRSSAVGDCRPWNKHLCVASLTFQHVSMACVHLASKIEEAPRRIRDVINVFHRLRHLREKKKPVPLLLDQDYVNLKNQIIKAERRVLKELGFCVHVKHPHKIIVMYLQVLECERNRHLVQTSWNYMNDSLRTDVFVRFQPESIACACIYLAARTLEIPLPNRPHWFLLFGATEEEIQEICLKILQLYTRKKVDLTHLEGEVEKRRYALDEAKAQAKGLLPGGTQVLDSTSRFSPAPKPELGVTPFPGPGGAGRVTFLRLVVPSPAGSRESRGIPQGRPRRQTFPTLCEECPEESGGREESQGRQPGERLAEGARGSKSEWESRAELFQVPVAIRFS